MKRILLTALAMASCAMQALSGTWQKPQISTFIPIADQSVGYLYNADTHLFLVNGNAYNTTASLGLEGLEVKFEDCSAENDGENAWKIRFTETGGLLFIGYASGCYYDGELKSSNMGHNLWSLTAGKDGATRISVANVDDTYAINKNAEEVAELGFSYFGWCGAMGDDGTPSKTECVYYANPNNNEEQIVSVDWQLVAAEDYALYAAKLALYNTLTEAETKGISTAEAEIVYADTEANMEQTSRATERLREAMTAAALMGATAEKPIDATFLIKDADCSSDKGWDCTTSHKTQSASYQNGEASLSGFIERWVNAGAVNGTLSASTMSQRLKALPAGRYRLEADAIACNQSTGEQVVGVTLFAAIDGDTLSCNVSTGNGKPEHYAIDIVTRQMADMTIGLEVAEGSNGNWMAVDNFRLTYYGVSDNPYLHPLLESIAMLESMEADGVSYWYSMETQQACQTMLTRAKAAQTGTPDEMQAMVTEVNECIKQVKAENDAYATVLVMADKVEQAQTDFAQFPTVSETMTDFYIELIDNYDDGAYSMADIAGLKDKYDEVLGNGIRADIEPGMDLTMLVKNPNFDNDDNSGWEGTRPSTQHEVAEVYNAGFDTYQTLTNMPKGVYAIRVNGFFRLGDAAAYVAHYNEGTDDVLAVLYANDHERPLCDIKEGMRTDANYTSGWAATILSAPEDETSQMDVFIPNMRISFAEAQSMGFYKNELETSVGDDGVLRFGIKTVAEIEPYSWTCFDTFTLTYIGATSTGIDDTKTETKSCKTEYFSVEGFRLPGLQRGINVVRQTMSDGSVKNKIVIKK